MGRWATYTVVSERGSFDLDVGISVRSCPKSCESASAITD